MVGEKLKYVTGGKTGWWGKLYNSPKVAKASMIGGRLEPTDYDEDTYIVTVKIVEVERISIKDFLNKLKKEQKIKEIKSARYQGRRKLAQQRREEKGLK